MVAIAGYSGALVMTSTPSVQLTNDVLTNPSSDKQTFVEGTAAHRYWDDTQAGVVQVELDDLQSVTITGAPTGGTFTLTFSGQTTSAIAYNATAAQVQSALVALSNIGSGNVSVTGGPGPGTPYTVEFIGALSFANQAQMTATPSFTGGSSPGVTVATLQNGQGWTTVSSGFTLYYCSGIVKFTNPYLGAAPGVRLSSVYYFPWTVLANVTQWQFDGQMSFQESTAIMGDGLGGLQAGAGYKTFFPLLLEGAFVVNKWWVPESQAGFVSLLTTASRLILSGVEMTGNRYEGYCYPKKASIKTDVQKLNEESLDFQLSGLFNLV